MELELTSEELRVLACLVEKSFTTPDHYPLTTNALTNACNQKTSRDPVVDYAAQLVDQTMLLLRDGGWARSVRGTGNRSFKHKHVVDERLGLNDRQLAVVAVLALRGPQSVGELRTRTERYQTFVPVEAEDADGADHRTDDADAVTSAIEATLRSLAEREIPLVRNVGRASGQSQDRWIQLLDDGISVQIPVADATSGEAASVMTAAAPSDHEPRPSAQPAPAPTPAQSSAVDVSALLARVEQLEQRVNDLEELLN